LLEHGAVFFAALGKGESGMIEQVRGNGFEGKGARSRLLRIVRVEFASWGVLPQIGWWVSSP
jgi:hypothetical protein